MRQYLILVVFAIIFLCAPLARAQQSVDIIPKRDKLLNGLPILVLERPGSGSVAVHLVIKSGATFDLVNKAGLSSLTAQMLLRGSEEGYTADRLKEELAENNIRLEITTGWDSTEIRMLGSSANFDTLIELLGRLITKPTFPAAEFDQLKADRIKQLESVTPTTVADEAFLATLYGSHPYGHNIAGTKASLAQIVRFDVIDFYKRFYIANNSSLVIAGDVKLDAIIPMLRKSFGGWRKGQIAPYTFVPPQPRAGVNIRLVEQANQPVTEIRMGSFALKRTDADYLPMQLLFEVLSRRLAARQGMKLQAQLDARKLLGPFLLSASVPNQQAAEAITVALDEIKRINGGVEEVELQTAKDRLIEQYRTNINSNTELAARWAESENYNLGATYVKDFVVKVSRIGAEDLRRVAGQYLGANNLTITVHGRASELESPLKKIGNVEIAGTQTTDKATDKATEPVK